MKIIETAHAQVIANAPTFTEIGTRIVSFLLQVLGFFAIIGLVITAILYFTSGGNENQIKLAKRSFFYSVVGAVIALGSLLIINYLRNFTI